MLEAVNTRGHRIKAHWRDCHSNIGGSGGSAKVLFGRLSYLAGLPADHVLTTVIVQVLVRCVSSFPAMNRTLPSCCGNAAEATGGAASPTCHGDAAAAR